MNCHAVFNCVGHNHELTDNRLIKETVLKYVNEAEFKELFTIAALEKIENVTSSAIAATSSANKASLDARNAVNDLTAQTIDFVNDAINNTAIEGGVLADTFVTMTKKAGVGTVARTQRDKNSDTITVKDFGSIGDGLYHPLSERYATLTEAQAVYPFVESLTDSIDWAATQAFLNECHVNKYSIADMTIDAVITKPLYFQGRTHKTNVIGGDVLLRGIAGFPLDYFLIWEGYFSRMTGSVRCFGYRSSALDVTKRNCKNGVLIGTLSASADGHGQGVYFNSITADYLTGYAAVFGQNAHFSKIEFLRGGYCGSVGRTSAANTIVSNWSNKSDGLVGQLSGYSEINVDKLPFEQVEYLEGSGNAGNDSNVFVVIDGESHRVSEIDRLNSKIRVIPQITSSITSGTLSYICGGTLLTLGNNSANTSVGVLQSIVCGIGARLSAMYGTQIFSFTTEFNGIGVCIARRLTPNIGSAIISPYFEQNTVDILEVWNHSGYPGLKMVNSTSLNANKIVSLYTFLSSTSGVRVTSGSYQNLTSSIVTANKTYDAGNWSLASGELTDRIPIKTYVANSVTLTVRCDEKLLLGYGKGSMVYCFQGPSTTNGAPTGTIVLTAGEGQTINGGESVTYVGSDYKQPLMLVVSRIAENTLKVSAINKAEKSASVVYDPPSIPANDRVSTTVTLTGVVFGDNLSASISRSQAGLQLNPYVSAADTVTVEFINGTAEAIDLASLTLKVKIA